MTAAAGVGGKTRRCPVCGKPAVAETQPFCSERCAEVDLHRWLAGAYAIPDTEEGEEEAPDPESPARDVDKD